MITKYVFTATATGAMALTSSAKTPTAWARGQIVMVDVTLGTGVTQVDISAVAGLTTVLAVANVTSSTVYRPKVLGAVNTSGGSTSTYHDLYIDGTIAITLTLDGGSGTTTVSVYVDVE